MVVTDLIDILQQYDPDMPVLVDGEVFGYDDIVNVCVQSVTQDGEAPRQALILSRGD